MSSVLTRTAQNNMVTFGSVSTATALVVTTTAAAAMVMVPTDSSTAPPQNRKRQPYQRIAVVGGGITGSCAAAELSRYFDRIDDNGCDGNIIRGEVVVFDQGRRGPGGRASHRSVDAKTGLVQPDDEECLPSLLSNSRVGSTVDTTTTTTSTLSSATPPTTTLLQFDHGCQFFRADTSNMQDLVQEWLANGWVAPWTARKGCLLHPNHHHDDDNSNNNNTGSSGHDSILPYANSDFFGVPSNPDDVYIGVGGMHLLPRRILNKESNVVVHRGTRVQSVRRNSFNKKWELDIVVGDAAYHDTKEKEHNKESLTTTTAKRTTTTSTDTVVQGDFDAVIFTDISSSSDAWHRASAGIPTTFRQKLPTKDRVRIPLFSCMVALSYPIAQDLPFDAFTVSPSTKTNAPGSTHHDVDGHEEEEGNDGLWFAAVSHSKPGFPQCSSTDDNGSSSSFSSSSLECWTLISTPSFAVNEIKDTTMRDPVSGKFKPQEDSYLNTVPGPALAKSFLDTIRPYLLKKKEGSDETTNNDDDYENVSSVLPEIMYLQAQRWGSGLPLPKSLAGDIHEICGTEYASSLLSSSSSLVYPRPETIAVPDYVFDDELGLYYAGDFISYRNPGFEAAALSGLDVATHIIASYEGRDSVVELDNGVDAES
jgi:hypothetical protein